MTHQVVRNQRPHDIQNRGDYSLLAESVLSRSAHCRRPHESQIRLQFPVVHCASKWLLGHKIEQLIQDHDIVCVTTPRISKNSSLVHDHQVTLQEGNGSHAHLYGGVDRWRGISDYQNMLVFESW